VTATKVCKSCKRTLPVSRFWKDHKDATGLRRTCKECMRAYSTQWLRNKKAKGRPMETKAEAKAEGVKELTCTKCARSLAKGQFSLDFSGKRGSVCRECIRSRVPKKAYDEKLELPAKPTGNPPCPKCQTRTNKLNFDGYGTLYECTNIECLDKFRVAAGRVLPEGAPPPKPQEIPPTSIPETPDVEAGSPETREEKSVANHWTCEICPAVFDVPQALGAHKRFVHAGSRKEKPGVPAKTNPSARTRKVAPIRPPKVDEHPGPQKKLRFAGAIAELREQRAKLEDEMARIDSGIEVLEKLG
jgi:hypothetical protein